MRAAVGAFCCANATAQPDRCRAYATAGRTPAAQSEPQGERICTEAELKREVVVVAAAVLVTVVDSMVTVCRVRVSPEVGLAQQRENIS